ncbi:MAG: elongation factor 1-beta [Candidatus Pacearchaeota archaeon]|nr:elongation factor 1-beta [Candidatus Pacearchaeota archaeon]
MATAALKIKIMEESPESNLEVIKENIKTISSKYPKVLVHSIEEEEIAFGLKALIVTLVWPEELDQDKIQQEFSEIPEVQSVQIIDFRRAIG